MFTELKTGEIIRFEDELCLVTLDSDINGYIALTFLTGCDAGTTTLLHIATVCNNVEKKYLGFGDLLHSMCSTQKEKISKLRETVLSQEDEIISLSDEIGALKDELQEHYEIADFKNKEIERLQKENLKSVNKDAFDKAVNDMLNNKDISTVEEVSAIMKLRSTIY